MWGGHAAVAAWDAMLTAWPFSNRALFAVGFSVVLEVVTAVYSLFFVGLERFRLCQSWRVEPHPEFSSPPKALVREALTHRVCAALARPVMLYFTYPLFEWCGMAVATEELPSFAMVLWQLFVFILVDDTLFYWSHRALHTPWLYKCVCLPLLLLVEVLLLLEVLLLPHSMMRLTAESAFACCR